MKNKSKQKLILCGLIALATGIYNFTSESTMVESSNYAESAKAKDYDLLGTKIFAPKKPTKLIGEEALEQYLAQHN